MQPLPEYPKRGRPIDAGWGTRVVDYLKSLTPLNSGDISAQHGRSGTRWNVKKRQQTTSAAAAADHPWKPYPSPYTGDGEQPADQGLRVRLSLGYIDAPVTLAENWNDEIVLSNNAEGRWVCLTVNIDQLGTVISCEITDEADFPVPDSPGDDGTIPSTIYVPLFCYDSADNSVIWSKVRVATRTNLTVDPHATEVGCADLYRQVYVREA